MKTERGHVAVWFVLVLLIAVLGLHYIGHKEKCYRTWENSAFQQVDHSLLEGCRIKQNGGYWMPANNQH